MSTPSSEIEIDLAALDAAATQAQADKDKKAAATADPDAVTVETDPPEAAEPVKTVLTPEKGLAKLQQQLNDETARRQAAERQAADASRGEAAALTEVQKSNLDQVKSAIERLNQNGDVLEGQYAAAMTAQDFAAAAKVQRAMAENAARLQTLENGKIALEKAPAPAPRAPADPVDAFCAKLSAPSAQWVRAHPEFVHDPHKHQQMIAAHELAIARQIKADTPEYFKSLEKTLDLAQPAPVQTAVAEPEGDDPMTDAAKPVEQRAAPAAAPVSRNGTNGRSNVVRLSAAEVEMAENMGMKPEEYARNKLALKKEGKLS